MRYSLHSNRFSSPFRRWLIVIVSLSLLTIGCTDDGNEDSDDAADDTDGTGVSDTESEDTTQVDTNPAATDTTDTSQTDTVIPVDSDSKAACQIGQEGCSCTGGGACDPGLTCLSQLCVNAGGDSDPTRTDSDTTPADADTTPADADTTPADADTTPADSDTTPADSDTTPADADTTPADSDTTPADSDTTPADSDTPEDTGEDTTPVNVCTAEATICVNDAVQTCNASGTAWEVTDSCTADEACNEETGSCLPLALSPEGGWVHRDTNGLGIQGAWYVYGEYFDAPDPNDTWEAATDGSMCMSGTAGSDNSARPSAEFQLCQSDENQTPPGTGYGIGECPFGQLSNIIGFKVTITGSVIPTGLRVMFLEPGREQPAFVEVGSGTTTVYISSARNLGGTPVYNPAEIERIVFQVQNDDDFDFCISNVTPVQ